MTCSDCLLLNFGEIEKLREEVKRLRAALFDTEAELQELQKREAEATTQPLADYDPSLLIKNTSQSIATHWPDPRKQRVP